jgi:hypothetical protein
MKIFVTEEEVLELAAEELDNFNPNPDRAYEIALQMDMEWNESLQMYEDVEEFSLRAIRRRVRQAEQKAKA